MTETAEFPCTILTFIEAVAERHDVHVYLEDMPYDETTTAMKIAHAHQARAACNGGSCRPVQVRDVSLNGLATTSAMAGAVEYLLSCNRCTSMCPLEGGQLHRIDVRATMRVKRANGTIVQLIDDTKTRIDESNFVAHLQAFLHVPNAQAITLQTGLSLRMTASICEQVQATLEMEKEGRMVRDWWLAMAASYPPWKLDPRFLFSRTHHAAWGGGASRRGLLVMSLTNALMDLMCVCKMLNTNVHAQGKCSIVYAGCAHAESVAHFFGMHFGPCVRAMENDTHADGSADRVTFTEADIATFI